MFLRQAVKWDDVDKTTDDFEIRFIIMHCHNFNEPILQPALPLSVIQW